VGGGVGGVGVATAVCEVASSSSEKPMDESKSASTGAPSFYFTAAHDRPLVDGPFPRKQDVSNGMLQVIVMKAGLKEVRVQA